MLIIRFDKQGVIHNEFVLEGQKVNSAFYVEVIGRLLKGISRVRPRFRAEGIGSCCMTMSFPDLAPADFFLFPMVKTAIKGKRFQDVGDKKNVNGELKAVHLEAFADCFQNLFERCNKCIQAAEITLNR
jgi:hypothetical protein